MGGLLLIAGSITLVVTLLRILGEYKGWDESLFNREAGGRSWFGIIWLVPVFGFMFGRRLAKGTTPPFVTSFFVPMFAAVGLFFAAVYCGNQLKDENLLEKVQYVYYAGPLVALLGLLVWPRAFMACLTYGLLARVPVMVVQYLSIYGNLQQTHYGKMLPGMPTNMNAADRLVHLTLAQAGFWLPFTILLGGGMAALGAATVKKA
jgi:hypothetical protein